MEKAEGSDDGHFRSVLWPHRTLPVALPEVTLGKDLAATQPVREVQIVKERVHSGLGCQVSLRKSPHGLQEQSFLRTICKGEAQGEVDISVIPSHSMASKSFLAASNKEPFSLRNLEAIGASGGYKGPLKS